MCFSNLAVMDVLGREGTDENVFSHEVATRLQFQDIGMSTVEIISVIE